MAYATAVRIIEALEAEKNGHDDGLFVGQHGIIVAWDGEFEYYRASAQQTGDWKPLTRTEAIAIVAKALPVEPSHRMAYAIRQDGTINLKTVRATTRAAMIAWMREDNEAADADDLLALAEMDDSEIAAQFTEIASFGAGESVELVSVNVATA